MVEGSFGVAGDWGEVVGSAEGEIEAWSRCLSFWRRLRVGGMSCWGRDIGLGGSLRSGEYSGSDLGIEGCEAL